MPPLPPAPAWEPLKESEPPPRRGDSERLPDIGATLRAPPAISRGKSANWSTSFRSREKESRHFDELDPERRSPVEPPVEQKVIRKMGHRLVDTAPRLGVTIDHRDLQSPVLVSLNKAAAAIALETWHHSIMFNMQLAMYVCVSFAIIMSIILCALAASSSSADLDEVTVLFFLDGFCRTLAVAALLVMLFWFPFELCQAAYKRKYKVLPEQIVLVCCIVFFNASPSFSAWSLYVFWDQFTKSRALALQVPPAAQAYTMILSFFTLSQETSSVAVTQVIFTVLNNVCLFLFVAFLMSLFGVNSPSLTISQSLSSSSLVAKQSASEKPLPELGEGAEEAVGANEDDEEKRTEVLQTPQERPSQEASKSPKPQLRSLSSVGTLPKASLGNLRKMQRYWWIVLLVTAIYLVAGIALIVIFDFVPSQVPFVSMITVWKVCPVPPSCTPAAPIGGNNSFGLYLQVSCPSSSAQDNCQPGYQGNYPLGRSITITAFFIIEVISMFALHRITVSTQERLRKMDYSTARSNHLGFVYFQNIKHTLFWSILLCSIIITSGQPVVNSSFSSSSSTYLVNRTLVTLHYSPLKVVGINFLSIGFGPVYMLLALFWFLFCMAYMPPSRAASLDWQDHPQYIANESDVLIIQQEFEQARKRMDSMANAERETPKNLLTDALKQAVTAFALAGGGSGDRAARPEESAANLGTMLGNSVQRGRSPTLERQVSLTSLKPGPTPLIAVQVNSNLLCLETEVLLCNFSFVAYEFGNSITQPMTFEEKQAKVGNPKYQLVAAHENAETDIQGAVFKHEDGTRIVVAFRGTSAAQNVWQDLDFLYCSCPMYEQVQPSDIPNDNLVTSRMAKTKPLVHRGFYQAYLSIRDAMFATCAAVLSELPDRPVLLVTGHSLGGALATHFAFDFGLIFEEKLSGLQCTTFGSPRVGNYSFVRRYQRIVPTTHRFVVAADPVSKLPPLVPFGEVTMRGFHHVGIEVLLDWRKANIVIGPSFVERNLYHIGKNNLGSNHVMGAYILTMMFWSAKVHGSSFVPDWWVIVINYVRRLERRRIELLLADFGGSVQQSFEDQVTKDLAMEWDSEGRALRHFGCETPALVPGTVCGLCATPLGIRGIKSEEEEEQEPDGENVDAMTLCPLCGARTFVLPASETKGFQAGGATSPKSSQGQLPRQLQQHQQLSPPSHQQQRQLGLV